jgi:hypothetical protein
MKIIAKQVPPEYQESPFQLYGWMDMWPGVIIHGNRWYNSHTTPEFDAIYNRFDGEKRILRALHLVTGKRYEKHTIQGTCQSDWQEVYFPVADYTPELLRMLEVEYFNLGSEWIINDDWSMYCYSWNNDGIRKEIADAAGTTPENVILQAFTGWKRTPEYAEVEA